MKSEIDRLQDALSAAPDHWETRRHLAECFYHEGDLESAARLIAEAPSLPADEEAMILAARLAATANPGKAHEILDALLEGNPDCADAHDAKAEIYEANDQLDDAAKHRGMSSTISGADGAEEPEPATAIANDREPTPSIPKPLQPPPKGRASGIPTPNVPRPSAVPPPDAVPVPTAIRVPDAIAPAPAPSANFAPAPDEDGDDESGTAPEAAITSAPPVLSAAEPLQDDLEGHLSARELHALEAEEEEVARRTQQRNKVASFVIALIVHAVIFLLLIVIIVAVPRRDPPEIVAIAAPPTDAPPDLDKKKVRPNYSTQTKPSSKVVQVLTATNYSAVAVPAIDTPPPEIIVPGLSMEDGFGMGISFQGAGDGWVGSLPAAIQSRCSLVERMNRLKVGGGNKACEEAVRRALVWLHENQNDDGSWGRGYPVAMTGLALLAFLGHCETPDSPEFAETVVGAATYLMDIAMKNDGKMMSPGGKLAYEHGIGTYALCELFTLSRRGKRKIPELASLLRQVLPHIVDGQNPNGSWNYGYRKGRSDTSVAGWQMQALSAARHTELEFPGVEDAFTKGLDCMVSFQADNGGFAYTDDPRDGKISLAGVGALALQFGGRGQSDEVKKALDFILETRKSLSYRSINIYEWYYSTQACFQDGGRTWDKWNDMFLDPLLEAQDKSGFWPPSANDRTDGQTKGDGDVYRTCLATLMLEVYYRYLPTGEKLKK